MIEFSLPKGDKVYEGKPFLRDAIRGVTYHQGKLLMIHSQVKGDYKFPGGGREGEESHEEALKRELSEECGVELQSMESIVGRVMKYGSAKEKEYDYFCMTSYYYNCTLKSPEFREQNLDDYEKKLQMRPVWIGIEEAITTNKKILALPHPPAWTERETIFLEELRALG